LEQHTDDAGLQLEVAKCCFRLGEIEWTIGKSQDAVKAFEEAAHHYRLLMRQDPDPEHPRHLAGCYLYIGNLQRDAGHLDQALQAYQEAQAELERLAERAPKVPRCRATLAAVLGSIGNVEATRSRQPEARRAYHRARKMFAELAGGDPDNL